MPQDKRYNMSLQKKFEDKYGKKEYERRFGSDFRQAVNNMDKMIEILSRPKSDNEKK